MKGGRVLTLLLVVGWPALAAAAPILRVAEPVWNVGQIVAGAEQRHSYVVENAGDEELIISEVDQCCGFLGTLEQTRLLPGARTQLNARLKQTKMIGNLHVELVLVSNDPQQPRTPVSAFGDVLPAQHALGELLLPGEFIDLGVMPPSTGVPFVVRFRSVGNEPLQIVGVDKGRHVLENGVRPVLAPGSEGELTFRYLREEPGPIDEEIYLVTNDPLNRTLPVRLKGYVHQDVLPRDALIVYPVGVATGYNPELGGYRYQVRVENRSARPVELLPPATSLSTIASSGGAMVPPKQQGTAYVTYPLDLLRGGPVDGRIYLQLVLPVELR
jgi:hypothetical protein